MPKASGSKTVSRELSRGPKGPNTECGPCIDIVYEFLLPDRFQGNTVP
jgi:hypothetical protein